MPPLFDTVKAFLKKKNPLVKPVLLALSGGPDSLCLFHLLLEADYPFGVAHIDHGWRPESSVEAGVISILCAEHRVAFHLCRLDQKMSANLEERARLARLAFYKKIMEQRGYESVLLGHHADDRAETILKRLFEGASLSKLGAMKDSVVVEGVPLWRPLASVRKKDILKWLKSKGATPFNDQTNYDERFLRTRLRTKLMPLLAVAFGKEVVPALCQIGDYGAELEEFISDHLTPFLPCFEEENSGMRLNLSVVRPKTRFAMRALLRLFFEKERMVVSNAQCSQIIEHLGKKKGAVSLNVKSRQLRIEKGMLFLLPEKRVE